MDLSGEIARQLHDWLLIGPRERIAAFDAQTRRMFFAQLERLSPRDGRSFSVRYRQPGGEQRYEVLVRPLPTEQGDD
jgi:hypothetical protein